MRDATIVIGEMLEAIDAARECCSGKTFEQFSRDRLARLALERAVEIISEASRHLPGEFTDQHPDIPWSRIKAIGNVLRHEYHRISAKIIWDVVRAEIANLEAVLRQESMRLASRPSVAIYKICSRAEWDAAERAGAFTGSAVDIKDGYIHFSTAEQAVETAAKHFAGAADLVLVRVEAEALGSALRWEPSRGGALFPHLYAPLPVALATWVKPLPLGPDGAHAFPPLA
jgi:uncharacterized protein (DUF952 family)/uncharacterized protein with HEPN domain